MCVCAVGEAALHSEQFELRVTCPNLHLLTTNPRTHSHPPPAGPGRLWHGVRGGVARQAGGCEEAAARERWGYWGVSAGAEGIRWQSSLAGLLAAVPTCLPVSDSQAGFLASPAFSCSLVPTSRAARACMPRCCARSSWHPSSPPRGALLGLVAGTTQRGLAVGYRAGQRL